MPIIRCGCRVTTAIRVMEMLLVLLASIAPGCTICICTGRLSHTGMYRTGKGECLPQTFLTEHHTVLAVTPVSRICDMRSQQPCVRLPARPGTQKCAMMSARGQSLRALSWQCARVMRKEGYHALSKSKKAAFLDVSSSLMASIIKSACPSACN